ncbi:MAG TPA: SDR family NAD(P)-dependent oxidoreductase [Prolixibacteraceae bacterium]|nr:SDR family NAD(P)-dependent oxidoreductase [Prolixibacteraceae bacterium]
MIRQYGKTALIAGASEGLGAAFAHYLAACGFNLVLVARRESVLQKLAASLCEQYPVNVHCLKCDLSKPDAVQYISEKTQEMEINLLVYNAAMSFIGPFLGNTPEDYLRLSQTNMLTPVGLLHHFGEKMVRKGKGAVVLMASLAGFQGSGYLAMYAATKAFNRVLAESLWYEWRAKGVDVLACCAGATSTPNYQNTKPEKSSILAPRVQSPDEVVQECFRNLGKKPSCITGSGNRFASFFLHRILSRKSAVTVMGKNTQKIYRL